VTTVQWRSDAENADSNGVVSAREWITGGETDGVTVMDLGAYCVTASGPYANTDWSDTPPEDGSGSTLWPGETDSLLPSAGTYLVPDGWSESGGQAKYFYWLTSPGTQTEVRWWRVIA